MYNTISHALSYLTGTRSNYRFIGFIEPVIDRSDLISAIAEDYFYLETLSPYIGIRKFEVLKPRVFPKKLKKFLAEEVTEARSFSEYNKKEKLLAVAGDLMKIATYCTFYIPLLAISFKVLNREENLYVEKLKGLE